MSGMGVAMMGTGTAEGDGRAMQAAQRAISSPLLEDSSVHGARGVIINVTGGPDLSLVEVNEASCVIQEAAHEDANIIFGAVVDPSLSGKVKITVIATGFDRKAAARPAPNAASTTPVDLSSYTQHLSRAAAADAAAAAQHRTRSAVSASEAAVSAAAQGGLPPSLTVNRRPGIELSLGTPAVAAGAAMGASEESPIEHSLFDVPAFLRRQN
jgi:cell division GTPase FtsZ